MITSLLKTELCLDRWRSILNGAFAFELKKTEVCLLRSDLTLAMRVVVTQATTGNTLFDQTHSYLSHFNLGTS